MMTTDEKVVAAFYGSLVALLGLVALAVAFGLHVRAGQ